MSIEDIVLDHDNRGVSALRRYLPENFCDDAASLILANPGTVLIATGFYIIAAGATETDGPPGAIAIGDALSSIGYEVVYVTDKYTAPLLQTLRGSQSRVVDFPITTPEESKAFAKQLLDELTPSVLVAIERCGLTEDGIFRNWRGKNISEFNAKIDYLFDGHPNTVGIGDGGNEIGMGNLASIIPTVPSLVKFPCITTTTKLVVTSVSNWGGYGLVAALSRQKGNNLLPSIEAERELVKRNVELGAVDGITTERVNKVDGFTLEENSRTVAALHELLAQEGIAP